MREQFEALVGQKVMVNFPFGMILGVLLPVTGLHEWYVVRITDTATAEDVAVVSFRWSEVMKVNETTIEVVKI